MNDRKLRTFRNCMHLEMPKLLQQFIDDNSAPQSLPAFFKIKKGSFVLEIANLLSASEYGNYDREKKFYAFAQTFEGYRLLVDMKTPDLQILQDECGDIDQLDVTLNDLVYSEKTFLDKKSR